MSGPVDALLAEAGRHTELPAAQLALAHDGETLASRAWGTATPTTLFVGYSTTKAVLAATTWTLMEAGLFDPDEPVHDHIPELGPRADEPLRAWHLLTHTAGFPDAPFDPLDWPDRDRRLARFASWHSQWAPGSRVAYHRASASWVLAELLERLTGQDFRDVVRERVTAPLDLDDTVLVGVPAARADAVTPVTHFGDRPDERRLRAIGLAVPTLDEAHLEAYATPALSAIGIPGGGGVMTAEGLAQLYQGLLGHRLTRDGGPLLRPETLAEALRIRTGDLPDPMTGKAANRALGVVVAGDQDRPYRSFGFTNSPRAFGHAGVGGQLSWGDPESGLSFAFLTNGIDRDPLRMGMRGARLATLAASIGGTTA